MPFATRRSYAVADIRAPGARRANACQGVPLPVRIWYRIIWCAGCHHRRHWVPPGTGSSASLVIASVFPKAVPLCPLRKAMCKGACIIQPPLCHTASAQPAQAQDRSIRARRATYTALYPQGARRTQPLPRAGFAAGLQPASPPHHRTRPARQHRPVSVRAWYGAQAGFVSAASGRPLEGTVAIAIAGLLPHRSRKSGTEVAASAGSDVSGPGATHALLTACT